MVKNGQTLEVDLVGTSAKTLEFDALLTIDGEKVSVGTPAVDGVKVKAEVLGEVKGEKLQVLKFKAKKRVHKRTGHRQRYSQIKITAIGGNKAKAKA